MGLLGTGRPLYVCLRAVSKSYFRIGHEFSKKCTFLAAPLPMTIHLQIFPAQLVEKYSNGILPATNLVSSRPKHVSRNASGGVLGKRRDHVVHKWGRLVQEFEFGA
eukprot:10072668-Karenia_brevis.AAC.1